MYNYNSQIFRTMVHKLCYITDCFGNVKLFFDCCYGNQKQFINKFLSKFTYSWNLTNVLSNQSTLFTIKQNSNICRLQYCLDIDNKTMNYFSVPTFMIVLDVSSEQETSDFRFGATFQLL